MHWPGWPCTFWTPGLVILNRRCLLTTSPLWRVTDHRCCAPCARACTRGCLWSHSTWRGGVPLGTVRLGERAIQANRCSAPGTRASTAWRLWSHRAWHTAWTSTSGCLSRQGNRLRAWLSPRNSSTMDSMDSGDSMDSEDSVDLRASKRCRKR